MAAAEALMELVPSGHSRRNGTQGNGSMLETDEEKERAMAATYAAYTKRARLQAEKMKAQQLSRQLKTRLQFARLKVDYGWTRQSLNEVENLYFHLSRARPTTQPHAARTNANAADEGPDDGPSTPPTALGTPTKASDEPLPEINPSTNSTQTEPSQPSSHNQSQPGPSTSNSPESSSSHPHTQQTQSQQSSTQPKRSPFVERTRTGGIVRTAQPVERLRTGGKVKAAPTALSPKKRGRPRIPDGNDTPSTVSLAPSTSGGVGGADGGLTYDSFWNSLGTSKSPGS